jgi:hypothetical protein
VPREGAGGACPRCSALTPCGGNVRRRGGRNRFGNRDSVEAGQKEREADWRQSQRPAPASRAHSVLEREAHGPKSSALAC